MNTHAKPIRIVYVAGCGRSGSTLLDNILGQMDGCFSCGELWHIWRRGVLENRLCSDGIPFREHPFWKAVFDHAFGGMDAQAIDHARILKQEARALRTSTQYPCLASGLALHARTQDAQYLDALKKLYEAIAHVSGSRVLIDSSKYPVYGLYLSRLPGMSVNILHLLRDPRAVAYSWQRSRTQPDKGKLMDRHSTFWSILQWRLANASAETLKSGCGLVYHRVRYEDLMASPRRALEEIAERLELGPLQIPFRSDSEVETRPNHAFSGNPSRFTNGIIRLAADDEWRSRMSGWRRYAVEALTATAMLRYGYR